MLKHDEYLEFRQKARRHMLTTLTTFHFWGGRVGRISGDIKEKFNEARWYAELDRSSLFELINPDYKYTWHPETSLKNKILHTLNIMSVSFALFGYMTILYKLFFYNFAYAVAVIKSPGCGNHILRSADYPKKLKLVKALVAVQDSFIKLKTFISAKLSRFRRK